MQYMIPGIIKSTVAFTRLVLCVAALAALAAGRLQAGEPAQFDSSFLQAFGGTDSSPDLDLDAIANSGNVVPGTYLVVVRLNQSFFGHRDVTFEKASNTGELKACLSEDFLQALGVKLQSFVPTGQALPACVDLEALIEDAFVSFDGNRLVLDISVPQIALSRDAAGYVAPEDWDRGINAATLNYQFTGAQTQSDARGSGYQYSLYTNGGFNFGDWRFRTSSSFRHSDQSESQWQRSSTYAERDLTALKSTMVLGETFTSGDVFEGVPFLGVKVATDVGMLPNSMQGYAPIIRGIAETQAKVEVRQNNYSLYTTYVAPGAFEIDDLTSAAGNGDLEVIITEADGRERRFTQPYASLPNMLREKAWRYSLSAGKYNAADGDDQPVFAQASLAYGLPFGLTLYGGVLGASFYRAGVAGAGKNLGSLGAVSLDATHSQTDVPGASAVSDAQVQGQSFSVRYAKAFDSGTSFRFAGYRYSTEGYRDFSEAVGLQQPVNDVQVSKRSKLEASISQALDSYGSLYLSVSKQNYWGSSREDKQAQLGFSTQFKGVSFGAYASKSLNDDLSGGSRVMFTVSMPLGKSRSSGTFSVSRNEDGSLDQRTGISGRTNDMTYNLNANRIEKTGTNGSGLIGYRAPFAQWGAGLSVGKGYRQASVSAAGSVLVHGVGVVFGQSLGETVALVEVKDTANVGVQSAPGTVTNKSGYAVVPYVTPYRRNRVTLDTGGLDANVDIAQGVTHVVPRRGAVVKAKFTATRSEKILLNVRLQDGSPLPFGTTVYDGQGNNVGVVGQGGQALVSVSDSNTFRMKWGEKASQRCELQLDISKAPVVDGYRVMDVLCQVKP